MGTDDDKIVGRIDAEYVEWVNRGQSQTLALSNSIPVYTLVGAQHAPYLVDYQPRAGCYALGVEKAFVVIVRNKANFLAVRFISHQKADCGGNFSHFGLF
ncbi:MAG: hypothetical protein DDT34_01791 [Firmicutes bacterium]|nr:hypothetical protein [Bacillota bacterium]